VKSLALALLMTTPPDYDQSIKTFRQERDTSLRKNDGWLSIVGLYWLNEGTQRLGRAENREMVLSDPEIPETLGSFTKTANTVHFESTKGIDVLQYGKKISKATMPVGPDHQLVFGNFSFFIHQSGERYAVRVKNKNSPFLKAFNGLQFFSVDQHMRVNATLRRHPKPQPVEMTNVFGDVEQYQSPGILEFNILRKKLSLVPVLVSGETKKLFIVFRDETSGKETYGAARFLYTDIENDQRVTLDFNKAQNPPCAFSHFTTCPLPPPGNHLPVAIRAGEKNSTLTNQ